MCSAAHSAAARAANKIESAENRGFIPAAAGPKDFIQKQHNAAAPASLISRRTSRGFLDHSIEGKLFGMLRNLGPDREIRGCQILIRKKERFIAPTELKVEAGDSWLH